MATVKHKTVNRAATVQKPAASLKGVQRKAVVAKSSVQIQPSMKVSSPKDPAEKEADVTAKKIMRMAVPESSIAYVKTDSGGLFRQVKQEEKEKKVQTKLRSPYINRFADSGIFTQPKKKEDEKIQRKAEGQPHITPNVATDIQNSMAAGSPLPLSVRRFMEPRFQANFSTVRIHTDPKAADLSLRLGARAFTYQNHIFFSRDQYQPETSEGQQLLAHELTHTIQQGASIQGHGVQRRESLTHSATEPNQIQRQEENLPWYERAGRAIGGAVELGESAFWRILQELAPDLVPIVRQGPVEWLKTMISGAVESFFNAMLLPIRPLIGVAPSLSSHFAQLIAWLRQAGTRIANGDCGAVTEAATKIQEIFEALTAPAIERIKALFNGAKDFFDGLWNRFGAPVWEFLQRIGGAAWARIQQFGHWIWDQTAPIRRVLNRAWTWIKNRLGIGESPEGQDGILQWVQQKAQSVWDLHIKPFYERYRLQILTAIGVLVMLSPAGPVIALGAAIAGLAAGIRWIRQHLRNRESIVQQRGVLQGVVIPGILNSVNRVSEFLLSKARFISSKLTEFVGGLNQAAGAVAGTVLNFAVGILRWLIDRFQQLVDWATGALVSFVNLVSETLGRLRTYLQPILTVLGQIAQVIGDVMRLPILLAGSLWNRIPACIRDPFVNFFIPLILRQIAFFRELAASPEAWQQTRSEVMTLIHQVFRNFDLLGAIRSAFRLVVRALRIPVDLMGQLLEKAANAWDAVIAAPLRFIENALKSILQGVGRFMRNILSHLWYGVQGWLFNAVNQSGGPSGVSVSPPSSWTDFRAVFGFVLDMLGISVDHVIELIDRRVPGAGRPLRAAVRFLTGALEWLQIAINEGPRGLWRHLTQRLSSLGTMVLESAVGWIMTRVVAIVGARLAALAASAGLTSVLEAVKAVYSAIQTAIEYMPRILGILIRVFDTVTQIASGVTAPAAEMVETGFRMAMPIVIGFLANYAGLGGIGERIVEIIRNVRQRVDDAILWLIDRAIATIRSLWDRLRRGVQQVAEWWQQRKTFSTLTGHRHTLSFSGNSPNASLILASNNPGEIRQRIQELLPTFPADSTDKRTLQQALPVIETIERLKQSVSSSGTSTPSISSEIDQHLEVLKNILAQVDLDPSTSPPSTLTFAGLAGVNAPGLRASAVTANPLSETPGNTRGSPAIALNVPGYIQTPTGPPINYRHLYVRTHLISARLHGPGNEASNLAMTPTGINTGAILHDVEEPIQTLLFQDKRVLRLVVTVIYHSEQGFEDFPNQLLFTWSNLDRKSPQINQSHPQPIPKPNFMPTAQQDLNTAIRTNLERMLGRTQLVGAVLSARPFNSFAHFKQTMQNRFPPVPVGSSEPDFRRLVEYMLPQASIILIDSNHLSASDIGDLVALRQAYYAEPGRRIKP